MLCVVCDWCGVDVMVCCVMMIDVENVMIVGVGI